MKRGVVMLCVLLLVLPFAAAVIVPNSNIKTVEFFVGQNDSQVNSSVRSYPVVFTIPESSPTKRHAWLEIGGISNGVVDSTLSINVSNNASDIFSLDSAGETQKYLLRYSYYPQIVTGDNPAYTLNIVQTGASPATSFENAKLVLTYEYDTSSPRQLNTAYFFVGQNSSAIAPGAVVSFPFRVFIPEEGPIDVESAFIEIEGLTNGAVDNTIEVNTTNGLHLNASLDSTAATQAWKILYNATEIASTITTNGTYNFMLNIRPNGTINTLIGARAVVTYIHNANASNKLNTVRYFIASGNNTIAANTLISNTFSVPIAEPNIQVQSAYVKLSGWHTAVTSSILVNISGTNQINYTTNINTEGHEYTVLYNASQLYSMTGGTTNGPYTLNRRETGAATTLPMAELYVTYNYTANAPLRTKTVEYTGFSDDVQRAANIDFDQLFFLIMPEKNVSMKSLYLESSSITSATAAHLLQAGFSDDLTQYIQGNTGETTFDYILRNASTRAYQSSEGVNGAFQLNKQDAGISSLTSGKVIATYFFQ